MPESVQHILRARHPTPSMRGVFIALAALAAAIAADAQTITVSTATQTRDQQVVTVTVSGRRGYHSGPKIGWPFTRLMICKQRPSGCFCAQRRCDKPSVCPHVPVLAVHLAL